jgi:hypothetical protein
VLTVSTVDWKDDCSETRQEENERGVDECAIDTYSSKGAVPYPRGHVHEEIALYPHVFQDTLHRLALGCLAVLEISENNRDMYSEEIIRYTL